MMESLLHFDLGKVFQKMPTFPAAKKQLSPRLCPLLELKASSTSSI